MGHNKIWATQFSYGISKEKIKPLDSLIPTYKNKNQFVSWFCDKKQSSWANTIR